MKLTTEQLKYINCDNSKNTKLLACAGSGKTRCIIERINKMIKDKFGSNKILMLTFSRLTRDDLVNKMKENNEKNDNNENNEKNENNENSIKTIDSISIKTIDSFNDDANSISIKTIDSFAKSVIDKDNNIDVELLSYQFMLYLNETNKEDIKIDIKYIFVDEAQDLNEIQYNILCLLRDKLDIKINLIGDPNQNIYQFRQSSDKYLREFEGETFVLTYNFRSCQAIIDFSTHLRPFNEYKIRQTKKVNDCKPIMFFYNNETELENNIINILKQARENNIDLSDFAILSPTRGCMKGYGHSNGLCFISNILYKAKIKFKQFYEEYNDGHYSDAIKYERKENHVNILTYMGSKGLEWKYVILLGADNCLINKRQFDKEKHNNDLYLLYVACSRAIDNMYIFSKCKKTMDGLVFDTNKWFKNIPRDNYIIDDNYEKSFKFSNLKFIDTKYAKETSLKSIINNLLYKDLNEISNLIDYKNRKTLFENNIYKNKYNFDNIENYSFFIELTYNYFDAVYNIKHNNPKTKYDKIEAIIFSNNIITNLSYNATQWYIKNKQTMTWDKFTKDKTINEDIKYNIMSNFNKDIEFNKHVVAESGYYQLYILEQKEWISKLYTSYKKINDTIKLREIIFYLCVITYSIKTQHYYHIKSKGAKFKNIINEQKSFFDDIDNYVFNLKHNFIANNISINKFDINANINLLDDDNNLWFIRCANEISLKQIIYSIITHYLYNEEENNKIIKLNYINLIKGVEITYAYNIKNIKEIMKILDIQNN